VLIFGGEVEGRAGVDVRVEDGAVVEVGAGLERRRGESVIDAAGGAVIPGLHDHHVHLRAMAAAAGSVQVGPAQVDGPASFDRRLREAARSMPPDGWVRAIGYHDSVAGALDRRRLDAAVPDRPVRVQHRSGALWVLNTCALAAVGADTGGDGRLWRRDRWLAERVPPAPLDLAAVGRRAAERGVTGFTDADPSRTQADVDLLLAGGLPQRLVLMSAAGLSLGSSSCHGGARKLLLDDATLPPLDTVAAQIAAAHAAGEPVAVHCVTRLQLVVTVAALAEAGAVDGDRIEHGGVVPTELHGELRRLGVTVVTQPNFVAERGDQYLAEVDPDDRPLLYPCGTLQAAGIAVAAGTDAPFGDADPWAAMRAAVHRRTPSGAVPGPGDRIAPAAALRLFLGHPGAPAVPRHVEPGTPADLCILDRPLATLHAGLAADDAPPPDPVRLTLVAGDTVVDRR
jgi:predicted amidohydrolase YtcJ